VVDDPYVYGQIAATNSLSDVWAMGGEAKLCMNVLMFPETLPFEDVNAILQGGYDKVKEAGAIIVGGHTIKDDIPKYGLCVSGIVHPDKVLKNNSIHEGDALILTKSIGTGVLVNAYRGKIIQDNEYDAMVKSMTTLNKYAADAIKNIEGVHACTDVTGFSILGHSFEMCENTGLSIVIDHKKIHYLTGSLGYASMGLVPAATYKNKAFLSSNISFATKLDSAHTDLLFDPQTAGGLLYSVAKEHSQKALDAIKKLCPEAEIIGHVEKFQDKEIIVI
jgi:selenide, water dikinase